MSTITVLEAKGLRWRRGDRDVLRGVDLVVRHGDRVALVGANGSGKSSLLALLAGVLAPDDGAVRRAPGVAVALAPQAVAPAAGATLEGLALAPLDALRSLERELALAAESVAGDADAAARYVDLLTLFEERGGFTAADRVRRLMTAFGLTPDLWARPAEVSSGGQRQRAVLAGVLASGADLLLLDEPTNHLDLAHRAAVAEAVRDHPGAVVVASHDRALLDAVATHVATLSEGRLDVRRGTYSSVLQDRALASHASARAERERQKRVARLDAMAAELARHGHRAAHRRRRRAEREREGLAALTPTRDHHDHSPEALATATGAARGELLTARHLRVQDVLDVPALRLERGERVALVGPSGSGKSTLLALLAGDRPSDDARAELRYADGVRLVTLDQTWRGLDPERSPRQTLHDWVSDARSSSLLALVGVEREAWDRPAATLSGGERARVALALLVAREADVLLLDEPTNDLDLPAIVQLEATLQGASAAMVVASHDERLIETLGAEVWALEGGAIVRYRGGVAGYRRGARRLEPGLERPGGTSDAALPEDSADTAVGSQRSSDPTGRADVAADVDRALDAERAEVEEALLDPTRWSERELDRWRARRRQLEARLLEAWDARAVPPAPPYRTREAGQRVWAEPVPGGLRVWLEDGPALSVRCVGAVGHVVPEGRADAEPLPWAWRALCLGAARLAHYVLPVEAVQVATPVDLSGSVFEALSPGWWVARRDELERREGWASTPAAAPSRVARARTRRRRRVRRGPTSGSVG